MRVAFEVPDKTWANAAAAAERDGTKIHAVIAQIVINLANGTTLPYSTQAPTTRRRPKIDSSPEAVANRERRYRELHSDGLTDWQIAEAMEVMLPTVRTIRRRLALPANSGSSRPRRR